MLAHFGKLVTAMNKYSEIFTDHAIVVGSGLEQVYVIYYDGWESRKKIGIAVDQSLGARLSSFVSTGAPSKVFVELIILTNNALEIERMLHARFKQFRSRGEWFEIDCLWSVLNPFEFDIQIKTKENYGLRVRELRNEIRDLKERRDFYDGIEGEITKKIMSLADELGIGGGRIISNKQFLEDLKQKIENIMDFEKKIEQKNLALYAREKDVLDKEQKLLLLHEKIKNNYWNATKPLSPLRKLFLFFKW